jgi:protein-tyrosine-phosphatase
MMRKCLFLSIKEKKKRKKKVMVKKEKRKRKVIRKPTFVLFESKDMADPQVARMRDYERTRRAIRQQV